MFVCMERIPSVETTNERPFDREEAVEQALQIGITEVEERLGKSIGEALPLERIAVTTELLNEIEARDQNADRFVAEVYAGMRRLAELELEFKVTQQKFDALYQ